MAWTASFSCSPASEGVLFRHAYPLPVPSQVLPLTVKQYLAGTETFVDGKMVMYGLATPKVAQRRRFQGLSCRGCSTAALVRSRV